MNIYYVFAVIFGTAALFCGYRGATLDSQNSAEEAKGIAKEQTAHIESQLKNLGNKIQALQLNDTGPKTEKEIEQIQSEYNSIAESFYRDLPVEVEEHKGRTATKTIQQLERTRKIEPHIHKLEAVAQGLVSAFNSKNSSAPIGLHISDFPINLFTPTGKSEYETRLSFAEDCYWLIRFVWYPDGTPALEFMRRTSQDFTTDSVQLVLVGENFRPSLNERISDDLKERVMKVIPRTAAPMEQFDGIAKAILETIIKHQLIHQSLKA